MAIPSPEGDGVLPQPRHAHSLFTPDFPTRNQFLKLNLDQAVAAHFTTLQAIRRSGCSACSAYPYEKIYNPVAAGKDAFRSKPLVVRFAEILLRFAETSQQTLRQILLLPSTYIDFAEKNALKSKKLRHLTHTTIVDWRSAPGVAPAQASGLATSGLRTVRTMYAPYFSLKKSRTCSPSGTSSKISDFHVFNVRASAWSSIIRSALFQITEIPNFRASSILLPVADIVLTTLNAKYIHAAFGLRYLMANLGALQERACIVEFDINQRATDIAEVLLARNPKIIGLGVYIWNAQLSLEVVQVLKRVAPQVFLILGGPEVSYETEQQPICAATDYVITGEADLKFAEVCSAILSGNRPASRILSAELPQLENLALPYDLYDDKDIANRIIYVEASRGCPFTCEFCLSSLEIPVRAVPLDRFLEAMGKLLARGVKHFKFVDRTFNLNINTSKAILEFFLERYEPGMFFHFEMIPDRLPEALGDLIAKFPPGALQFEVGIQTFNLEVSTRIKRRQNYEKLADNFHFLRGQTRVHIHADLIVGLPGENIESFAAGFDRLVALGPQEIQVGILKRLRGTPIVRHDQDWGMVYSATPPYEILRNKCISFEEMQKMRRFSRHWDLIANSGNFLESTPLIWNKSESPFAAFMRWSDWLYAHTGRNHGIALGTLVELMFKYLVDEVGLEPATVANTIYRDYERGGRSDKPELLRPYLKEQSDRFRKATSLAPKRQARHITVTTQ
jgi:radical SAM superfamily enzyme YgiQ (UPF0313 family)